VVNSIITPITYTRIRHPSKSEPPGEGKGFQARVVWQPSIILVRQETALRVVPFCASKNSTRVGEFRQGRDFKYQSDNPAESTMKIPQSMREFKGGNCRLRAARDAWRPVSFPAVRPMP
jgi:hypothetical protein